MSYPYVSKARGRDPYTLYCYNIHCLDISNEPTEFNVPTRVSQNNTQKSTAPTIESRKIYMDKLTSIQFARMHTITKQ